MTDQSTNSTGAANPLMPQKAGQEPVQPSWAMPHNVQNTAKPQVTPVQQTVQTQSKPSTPAQTQPTVAPVTQKTVAQLPPKQVFHVGQQTPPPSQPQKGMSLDALTGGVSGGGTIPPNNTNQQNTGQGQQRVPQVVNIQKKGSKVSLQGFLIGCFVFLVVIFGIIGVSLYYIIQNPEQVGGNINIDTVKQGLRIFGILFFAFLFLFGFGSIIVNGFRLASVKEGSKAGYIFGLFFGFLLTIGSIVGGIVVLQNIDTISGSQGAGSTNIVLAKVPTKTGQRYFHNSPGLQVIAPMNLTYELNKTIFDRTVLTNIGGNDVRSVILNCGNEQTLTANLIDYQFQGSCLYQKKGDYALSLSIIYVNRSTGVQQEAVFPAGTLPISTEISLSTANGPYVLNDAKTEIGVGKAPAKVLFDSSKVFTDFGLENFDINRDLDGDGIYDRTNDVAFAFNYKKAGVNTLFYNIPALGEYIYELKFRVDQSDVPICEIIPQVVKDSTYDLIVQCDDLNTPITEYGFEITDASGKKVVSEKTNRPIFKYSFPSGGGYTIKLTYITNEGKIGTYESETIDIGKVNHDVNYLLYYKPVKQTKYELVDTDQNKKVFLGENGTITVKELPMEMRLVINSITPVSSQTKAQILLNDEAILSTDSKEFMFTVRESSEQNVTIRITEGQNEDQTTMINLPILVSESSILGRLIAVGGTVGFDPFTVKFDASTTAVTDADDEIIFFTWDFGDGQKRVNTSQSIISHTYNYDYEKEVGQYSVSLTIKTKKGIEETIRLADPILVKKREVKASIKSSSHLSQIGYVGETVNFTLTSDGDPFKVLWDFGDGQTLECDGRSCLDTQVTYDTIGNYQVKATIRFSDGSETVTDPFKIIIEQ